MPPPCVPGGPAWGGRLCLLRASLCGASCNIPIGRSWLRLRRLMAQYQEELGEVLDEQIGASTVPLMVRGSPVGTRD